MNGINTLEYGAGCVVTTRHLGVVFGRYLGIEVAHGDRALIVAGRDELLSVPFDQVISAAGGAASAA